MGKKSKTSCKMVPNVPGTQEASEMYKDLNGLTKNRPLTNFIYASYLQPGVAEKMDALGYRRSSQGQHRANDIYNYFEISKFKEAVTVKAQSKIEGFSDSTGTLIDFDSYDAYVKAQTFNNANAGRVAYVVQHGNKFNILIDDKDSRTQIKQAEVNRALVQWNSLSEELASQGFDINELAKLNPTLVNPGNVQNFVKTLNILGLTPNDGLSTKDIQLLISLNPDSAIVNNVMSRGWGNLEEVSQRIYDIEHGQLGTQVSADFINKLLDTIKALPKLNKSALNKVVKDATTSFSEVDESISIQKTLDDLDKKYHLENDVFSRKSADIQRVSDATADAAMSLERQIRNIENKIGKTPNSEALTRLKNRLMDELRHKQYASGLLDFMSTAMSYIQQVNNTLNNVTNTGTNLEYAKAIATATSQANNLLDAYYGVVDAVAGIDGLINDFAINDADKASLKNLAEELKQTFDAQQRKVQELQREAMINIGKEFIGEHNSLYGKDIADIIDMAEADSSITDYLYSIGRSSNAVISMLGAIIRDAQNQRDHKLENIALQIRRATHILTKDGKDSSFMYDKKGRIKSQYDWDAYFKARTEYMTNLMRAGFRRGSSEFEAEVQLWEDKHTVEVEVDSEAHRFEKMPAFYLTTDFRAGWSAAQNEYYDRMMELKGQIGTLLPNYAQHQYIAPQKRTSWDQVLKEGIQGKRSFSNVAHWLIEDAKKWKLREDDSRFRKNGIYVEGEESIASLSDYDNTVLRQIPIFYIKKIDANDLSHDFSSALQSLASTALNYEAMEGVKDLAEMMTDYAYRNAAVERDPSGKPKVDSIINKEGLSVVINLRKSAQDNKTASMLDAFTLKHIYGVENKDKENVWAVICSNLIGYTSLKGLAVNVKGALTNKYVGVIQAIINSFGGQYYTFGELMKAEGILLGEQGASTTGALLGGVIGGIPGAALGLAAGTAVGTVGMTGKFMDILTNNKNSKDTLIAEFFDQAQENYSNLSDQRYHHTMFGRLFGSFNPMAMYSRGEYWIHMLNVYATLLHEKVVQVDPNTGEKKVISVYEALEKGQKIDGNTELKLRDNILRIDGKKIDGLSDEYFNALKRRIRYVNQQCHGSMNKEDKGLIHQWMLGKMSMNFRQWMVEHYSRRFRKLHWDESIRDVDLSNFYTNTKVLLNNNKVNLIDALEMVDNTEGEGFHYEIKEGATTLEGKALTDEVLNTMLERYADDSGWRRGFKTDALVTFNDFVMERQKYGTTAKAYWNNLSETQKADVKQVMGESFMLLALAGLSACMGEPDDHKGEFFYRLWMYVVKRCLFDEKAATIPGAIIEAKTIINNPIASAQTVAGLLYPILGITDITKTIKSGRYKGWNKYERNVLKYTIPFYSQIDQLLNIGEESGVFQTFDNQITR